ncbi:MAG TPA: heparan-alpha-glucosaminide N-acetyltransferase domain-containing protein [Puia sp.]|nr:heparan-alpha-glucosaminide N-acetyltransferase domain-containing protein [Puia sp.]
MASTFSIPTAASPSLVPSATKRASRIASIDLLRGVVMIVMALDHVRDYFNDSAYLYDPTDLHQTTPALFFTRWITHYCAPIFMLLAGVAAWLYGNKNGRKALSLFLLTRGAWLVFVELFIVSLGWTFNIHFTFYILQVIWAFGICMILLSALVHIRWTSLLVLSLVLLCGHNLLDPVQVSGNGFPAVGWALLHRFRPFFYGNFGFFVGYPILPWLGIIVLGFCLGRLYAPDFDAARRRRMLRILGFLAIAGFVLLRAINVYGDPAPWSIQRNGVYTLLSFLNVTKYPPSLLYVLMTLGPAFLFLSYTERPLNAVTAKITVFGRVPFFYYIVHIYAVHGLAVLAAMWQGHAASDMITVNNWVTGNPLLKGYGFGLGVVYGVWIGIVLLLYPLCRWFDGYKRAHQTKQRWLSYL